MRCKLPDGGVLEKGAQRELDAEHLTHLRYDARRKQGVASQSEEIVPQAHAVELEDLCPDCRERLLQRRTRSNVLRSIEAPIRFRESATIHLAMGCERQFIQNHAGRRNHVFR